MKSPAARWGLYFGLAALVAGVMAASGCALINKAPVIVSLEAGKDSVSSLNSTELHAVAYDPDGDEMSYEWAASGGTILVKDDRAIWTAPQVPVNVTDTITVKVKDSRGVEVEGQLDIIVTPNTPPVIESLAASRTQAERGDCVIIDCVATDAEQDSLTYTWSATEGSFSRSGPVAIWQAPAALGSFTITVVVADGKGNEASSDVTVEVATNQPPVIRSLSSRLAEVLQNQSTTITCEAFDGDADDLTYVWTATVGELSGEGATITWTAKGECGQSAIITATVRDGHGGEDTKSINLTVRVPG